MKYTESELDAAALADLLADATSAEQQSTDGPFYPERGITCETLREYAAKCRAAAWRYRFEGAHKAVLAA